jgi:zinc/manganese transport system substrate-binding protein
VLVESKSRAPRMRRASFFLPILGFAIVAGFLTSCSKKVDASKIGKSKIDVVVTYSILGSIVHDLADGELEVKVLIPNGLDVHEWEPSAQDMESLMKADLIVMNGLGLEEGMNKALARARESGRRIFTASDHIAVRRVGEGEGIPGESGGPGDPDQVKGAQDPHLWTDPRAMKLVADALVVELRTDFGLDVSARGAALDAELLALDAEIRSMTASLPPDKRRIVTGHESMGYFAQAYGYKLVGALVPSLSSEAETSAAWLVSLKRLIAQNRVEVIFTEVGTPKQVVDALAKETGAKALPLATHSLPPDGSYISFARELASTVVKGLQ